MALSARRTNKVFFPFHNLIIILAIGAGHYLPAPVVNSPYFFFN